MIKNRLKKIGRLTGLIVVRQIIFLGRNLYHLIVEPNVAIRELWAKKDKSEMLLLALVLTMPSWGYMASRIMWDAANYGVLMPRTGAVFQIALTIQALIFCFIGWGLWRGRK